MTEYPILVLFEHRYFGWKFNLYTAVNTTSGGIQLLGSVELSQAKARNAADGELELIRLLDAISDKSLMKHFSREKDTNKFKENVSPDTLQNLIRPRIEICNRKVVECARNMEISVYLRDNLSTKVLYERHQIHLLPHNTQCLFHFIKETPETEMQYFISLTNGEREISLQTQPGIIISHEPCVALIGNEIHWIDVVDSKKILPFFTKKSIRVPLSTERSYLQNFVLKTMRHFEVRLTGIPCVELHPERKALLRLEEGFLRPLQLRLVFYYGDQAVNPDSKRKKNIWLNESADSYTICWYSRDLDWEKNLQQQLADVGLSTIEDCVFFLNTNEQGIQPLLIEWLNKNMHRLSDFVFEQQLKTIFYLGTIQLQLNIDTKIDWFDLHINVVFDDFVIPFIRFKKHILSGTKEFVLPDKRIAILPDEWFEQYQEFFKTAKEVNKGIQLKKIHVGLLPDEMVSLLKPQKREEISILQQQQQLPATIPAQLKPILRSYQKEGFFWLNYLCKAGFGGCLADDMGLGKTLQTITLLSSLYQNAEKEIKPDLEGQWSLFAEAEAKLPASLIIAPTSLIYNWQNELKKFAPELKVYVHSGIDRVRNQTATRVFDLHQVVLTTYGTIRNDAVFLREYVFNYIILDESQFIKNHKSQTYQSVKRLDSFHKLVLTGTPIENSLSDLWSQFNFINEGLLGSFSSFNSTYIQKITKEKNESAALKLQRLIRPFLLRRTKEEVTPELPSLSQQIIYCEMSEEQKKVYETEKNRIRNGLLEAAESDNRNNLVVLAGLNRLRQVAIHPAMVIPEYAAEAGKFEEIILSYETIRAGGHKVLLFSSYVKQLELLTGYFDKEGWKYALLTGQTSVADRQKEIKRFEEDPEIGSFFISLKAGGTGLNLTSADYVFILDPWWNPAAELQAISRAHRIGQKNNVIAYRFISIGTVEEKILRLQEKKTDLFETFVQSTNPLEVLCQEEIDELFT